MAVIRKQILLEPAQNARLKAWRADTGMSESELVRRALDCFDPYSATKPAANSRAVNPQTSPDPNPELLAALSRQNERTALALDRAAAELDLTLRALAGEPIDEVGTI